MLLLITTLHNNQITEQHVKDDLNMKRNADYGQKHYPMHDNQNVGKLCVSQGKLGIGVKGKPKDQPAPKSGHYGVIESMVHGLHTGPKGRV